MVLDFKFDFKASVKVFDFSLNLLTALCALVIFGMFDVQPSVEQYQVKLA